jgi:hypothetical protein
MLCNEEQFPTFCIIHFCMKCNILQAYVICKVSAIPKQTYYDIILSFE